MCTKWNSAAMRSLLLFMAGWFLVEKCVTCQSRKSDFGWHRFRFSPCLMRKGWKVWSHTGLTWYLSGAASWMISLSNYCIWWLFFTSNLMKSSVVYVAIYRVFQKFVLIVNCILRKAFNASLVGKCKLIQVRNLSK